MKKTIGVILSVIITLMGIIPCHAYAEDSYDAKSVILMESTTGRVLYEINADEKLPPASVTKIMTMLIVMEAVDNGSVSLTDMVTVSEKAASMGGSQVYLEPGEQMSIDEMLKCVAVASANDAALALAEHIAGSEEEFVNKMNYRAGELGMYNTHFENTNGLDDTTENHLTTARDIGIMSCELLKHEKILDYTTIWMDTVRNGQFGLSNTNRLIRYYKGANGLKTGSTSKAKFCISASAKRDGLQLVAVVMASSTRDARNTAAAKLLDYGFANYSYIHYDGEPMDDIAVRGGNGEAVGIYTEDFGAVVEKNIENGVTFEVSIPEYLTAPVTKGSVVGEVIYKTAEGEEIGRAKIYASGDVEARRFGYQFKKIFENFLLY